MAALPLLGADAARDVRQQIERLVDAIVGGTAAAALRERLTALERQRLDLEAALAAATAPAPWLHPNLASVYRQKEAELTHELETEDAAEARDLVRSLVETITLVPADGHLPIEVRGELAAILQLAHQASSNRQPGGDGLRQRAQPAQAPHPVPAAASTVLHPNATWRDMFERGYQFVDASSDVSRFAANVRAFSKAHRTAAVDGSEAERMLAFRDAFSLARTAAENLCQPGKPATRSHHPHEARQGDRAPTR